MIDFSGVLLNLIDEFEALVFARHDLKDMHVHRIFDLSDDCMRGYY